MNVVDECAGSERLVCWGTPTIRSSRAHVAGAAALAVALFAILAVSFSTTARASAIPRSYYTLTVTTDQQTSPDIALRFFLDSPWNGTLSLTVARTITLTVEMSDELSLNGTSGAMWSETRKDVSGDANFSKTVQVSPSTLAGISANPGSSVTASIEVWVVYTDDRDRAPRTIYSQVTFSLNYQAPGKIEFAGAAIAGLGGAGAVGLALYVRRRAKLEELFLMQSTGTLIRHWTHQEGPVDDGDVVSGMLIVLQEFVRDSFDDRESPLQELRFGKQRVILVRGQHTILAGVARGRYLNGLPGRLQVAIWEFEGSYADILPKWEGDADMFARADLLARRFIRPRHSGLPS